MGYKAEKNCARCPETTRLVEQIPGMTTAFFSILSPHKHIPAHRGVFKGFVRYHLGLKIPDPSSQCRIRIEDEFRNWEEGESMVFDDTFEHEVWNDSNETRVVLFVDILRPLPFVARKINQLLISLVRQSAYIQDARKNQDAWEATFNRDGRTPVQDTLKRGPVRTHRGLNSHRFSAKPESKRH
jgi:ornithine lipid ester-linked acyl 2-hydroxylase